ncbi:MAG: EAL domain-containing protein [Gammaproteobacteria bacterium]|nr:EAL domain-containing protein [Gammaproteobacteria bacterium]
MILALHTGPDSVQQALLALASDFSWVTDLAHRYTGVWAEDGASEAPAWLVGHTPWGLASTAPDGAGWEGFRATLERHAPFRDFEFATAIDADRHVVLSISGAPVHDESGRFSGYRGVGRDVTHRHRHERELERFRAAVELCADGIGIVDRLTMRFVDANASLCRMTGYSRAELLDLGPQELLAVDPATLATIYDDLIDTRTTGVFRSAYLRRDGQHVAVEILRRAHWTGEHWQIVTTAREIGDRLDVERELEAGRARFAHIAHATNDVLWEWQRDTNAVWWNDAFYRILGYDAARLPPGVAAICDCLHPEDAAGVVNSVHAAMASGAQRWEREFRCRRADGSYASVVARAHIVCDANGRAVSVIGGAVDCSERRAAEAEMRARVERQRLLAEFGQQALARSDTAALMQQAVELAAATLGRTAAAVLQLGADGDSLVLRAASGWPPAMSGRRLGTLADDAEMRWVLAQSEAVVVEDYARETRFAASPAVLRLGYASALEVRIPGGDQPYGVLAVHAAAARPAHGDDVAFLLSLANTLGAVLERRRSEDRRRYMAQFDDLTGLPNRHLCRDRLAQTIAQAERSGWLLGVLILDLDGFKSINDSYGHRHGDRLLVQTGQRIAACMRPGDTTARFAGDEFAVVLADLHRSEDAGLVAQKILAALAEPFELDGETCFVTASVGVSLYPADGADADTLLRNADAARYRAEQTGRGGYQFYLPHMTEITVERLRNESQLRGALEREEFELHYQPKVELGEGTMCGFEALLRWRHPERGLVSPGEFIPALEHTGLIMPAGRWVLDRVCARLGAWREAGLDALPIAVNLSARQFQDRTLERGIRDALARHGVDPRLLELEITESMLMHDPEAAVGIMRSLRATGVRLSIDDFGTGYSSLAYLQRFPLDALKIDRTFIDDVCSVGGDALIATAVINLAHTLRLKVVAEGVETAEQCSFLAHQGCDEIQGYYFSRPLTAADATALLRGARRLGDYQAEAGARPALLLVDDDPNELLLLGHTLRHEAFEILTADSPSAAIEILARRPIALIVSDYRMPEMTGVEFLARVRLLYPEILRIVATSSDDPRIVAAAINEAAIHKFLSKDWPPARICAQLREAWREFGGTPVAEPGTPAL